MTVQTTESSAEFITNGVTTEFPFFFKFLEDDDLEVTYIDAAGTSTVLTLGLDYTAVGAGKPAGWKVTTTTARTTGKLVVARIMDTIQQTSLRNQGSFFAETHEDVFDRLTMLIQQAFTWLSRALLRPFGKDYYDAEGRIIRNGGDPALNQDFTTLKWVQQYIGQLFASGQGPANVAQNVLYVDPDLVTRVVQDMSRTGDKQGANMLYLNNIRRHIHFESDDAIGQAHGMSGRFTSNAVADTLFLERIANGGAASSGYAVHCLDSGTGNPTIGDGGGAIGGATDRLTPASAIVGNRRGTGQGYGVIGSRLESGNGDGVQGFKAGSGAGNGVQGYIVQTAQGHGVFGKHEGSVSGSGVFGERQNGAGEGPGVLGHAAGIGVGVENASVMGFKLPTETSPAGLFDGRGVHAALRAFSATSTTAKSLECESDVTATAPISNTLDRNYGLNGTNTRIRTIGGGARTGIVQGLDLSVAPTAASSGASAVYALSVLVGANVTGSADVRCANYNNNATGITDSYGFLSVVNGSNTRNYAVYGNAVGGATNWSGYFVGNVFYGGTLTPSDRRLKDNIEEVDYAQALSNVLACPVYTYRKHAAYMERLWEEQVEDRDGNLIWAEREVRTVVAEKEIGNMAQDIEKVNPENITRYLVGDTEYLSVSDRSELFQLKAAVKYLVERLREGGIEI